MQNLLPLDIKTHFNKKVTFKTLKVEQSFMQYPSHLQKGDTVALVSTARKLSQEKLTPALQILNSWGLQVIIGATVGASAHQFAGTDSIRVEDFQKQLDNPTVKAIWCVRGGYGTVRIIDSIDFSGFLKHPKWIIGYSDVTVLHSHLHQLGVATIHAQMALDIEKKTQASQETLQNVLFGIPQTVVSEVHSFNRYGTAKGELVGGNLSILYSLCGSTSSLDTRGKILFLEDLDEYLYHIDRMIQNLKRNGMLENLVGLVVGGMTQMNDNAIPFGKTAEAIITEAVSEYNYPVCFGFPAGHIQDNRALIFGKEHQLIVNSKTASLIPQ